MSPKMIIVSGPPAAGKSYLAEQLRERLGLPVISKDEIKEQLFDSVGQGDRNWSKKIGAASFELMYLTMEKLAQAQSHFTLDADFSNYEIANRRVTDMASRLGLQVFQVNLCCEGETLFARFKQRSLDGSRHPGHVDDGNFEEFKPTLLLGRRLHLDVAGPKVEVDTTDFTKVAVGDLCAQISAWLNA